MPSRLPYFASCHGGKATIPEGVTLLHLEYDVASGLQLAAVARDVHTLCLCLYSFLSLFLCSSFVSFSLSLSISLFVPLSLLQVRNTSGCFPACFFAEKGQKTNSKPKWQRGCALCHLSPELLVPRSLFVGAGPSAHFPSQETRRGTAFAHDVPRLQDQRAPTARKWRISSGSAK